MDKYNTSDFLTICFLIAKDLTVDEVRRNGKRCEFIFNDVVKTQKLVDELMLGRDTVSATKMFTAMKRVKSIVHSGE